MTSAPSLVLQTTTRLMMGLLLLFSLFLLMRGHYEPGGGFSGGLVAASAITLYGLAFGMPQARKLLRVDPEIFIPVGLCISLGSALIGPLTGDPFFTGTWDDTPIPVIGKIGSPFTFDIGVYFVVLGVTLSILFNLGENEYPPAQPGDKTLTGDSSHPPEAR